MTTTMDPTVRGHQPAGHKRWERAAQWAAEKPHTKMAKEYLARSEAADTVQEAVGSKPWLLFRAPSAWRGETDPVYLYQCCSTRCAVLQLQLELACYGLEELHARVLDGGKDRVSMAERPADSKRRGVCKACGKNVV